MSTPTITPASVPDIDQPADLKEEQTNGTTSGNDSFIQEVRTLLSEHVERQKALTEIDTAFSALQPKIDGTSEWEQLMEDQALIEMWAKVKAIAQASAATGAMLKDYHTALGTDPASKLDYHAFEEAQDQLERGIASLKRLRNIKERLWKTQTSGADGDEDTFIDETRSAFDSMNSHADTLHRSLHSMEEQFSDAERFKNQPGPSAGDSFASALLEVLLASMSQGDAWFAIPFVIPLNSESSLFGHGPMSDHPGHYHVHPSFWNRGSRAPAPSGDASHEGGDAEPVVRAEGTVKNEETDQYEQVKTEPKD